MKLRIVAKDLFNFPRLATSRLTRSPCGRRCVQTYWSWSGKGVVLDPLDQLEISAIWRPPKCNIFTQWRTGSERLLNAFWTPFERVRVSTGTPTGLNGPKCWLFYTLVRIDTGKFRVRTGPYGFVRFSKEIKTIECKIPAKIVSGGRFSVLDPVNVRLESSATVFGTKRFG